MPDEKPKSLPKTEESEIEEGRQSWLDKPLQSFLRVISPSPLSLRTQKKRHFSRTSDFSYSTYTPTPTLPLLGPRLAKKLLICCECTYRTPANTAAVCLGPPGIVESKGYVRSCHHRFCRKCLRVVLKRYWTCGECEKVNAATEGWEACRWCGRAMDRSWEMWWGCEGDKGRVIEVTESFWSPGG